MERLLCPSLFPGVFLPRPCRGTRNHHWHISLSLLLPTDRALSDGLPIECLSFSPLPLEILQWSFLLAFYPTARAVDEWRRARASRLRPQGDNQSRSFSRVCQLGSCLSVSTSAPRYVMLTNSVGHYFLGTSHLGPFPQSGTAFPVNHYQVLRRFTRILPVNCLYHQTPYLA